MIDSKVQILNINSLSFSVFLNRKQPKSIDIVPVEIPLNSFKRTFVTWKKLNLQSMENTLNCWAC